MKWRNGKNLGKSYLIVTLAFLVLFILIMIHAEKNMAHVRTVKSLCSWKEHADLKDIQSNSSHVERVLTRHGVLVLFLVSKTKDLRRSDWRGAGLILCHSCYSDSLPWQRKHGSRHAKPLAGECWCFDVFLLFPILVSCDPSHRMVPPTCRVGLPPWRIISGNTLPDAHSEVCLLGNSNWSQINNEY